VAEHSPYVPFDPAVHLYDAILRDFLIPWEYRGWRAEQLSWKQTAYIHGNLNPSPWTRISGPDAAKFLESVSVNSFARYPIGTGKHLILCNEDGHVMSHGVLLRTGEEEFEGQWLAPYLDYLLDRTDLDLTWESTTGQTALFQIAGPRSFDILAAATGEDLSDIRFMWFRDSSINGIPVRVLRMGMGGALAYEVHAAAEHAHAIYQAIVDAGEPFGIERLGTYAYLMNHSENGFPQSFYHFPLAWDTEPGFTEWLRGRSMGTKKPMNHASWRGSIGDDIQARYRNPIELGWGTTVRFDHDFPGRAALEREAAQPRRRIVTLEWSTDDIMDIHRSQYEPGEPYMPIDEPNHVTRQYGGLVQYADRVEQDGKVVGISSGRCYTYYYRRMISIASIDASIADGEEVVVIWGDPGTRQKEIRATVTRYPYLDLPRNAEVDVAAKA